MAFTVIAESLLWWGYLIYDLATVAVNMKIPPWGALTASLGAGVFGVMMFTSARCGVSWKDRVYASE